MNAQQAQDIAKIRASESKVVLDAYEAEARRRGIDPHEVTAILEIRRKRGWV